MSNNKFVSLNAPQKKIPKKKPMHSYVYISCIYIHIYTYIYSPYLSNPDYEVWNACYVFFYFHGKEEDDEGIGATQDALMAFGASVIGEIATIATTPQIQVFSITGGLGKYVGAKGTVTNDFSLNPGYNTFQVELELPDESQFIQEGDDRMMMSDLEDTIIAGYIPPSDVLVESINGYSPIYDSEEQIIGTFGLACK